MLTAFYISALIAVLATVMVITRANPVHALLYLIVSLLAVALIFFLLGAHFVAALEVIIYAGAIMVLFAFVIMMLNVGPASIEAERRTLTFWSLAGPAMLGLVLVGELVWVLSAGRGPAATPGDTDPKALSIALFGTYLLGVELSSMVLLAGLVGAYHLGRREPREQDGDLLRHPRTAAGPNPSPLEGEGGPEGRVRGSLATQTATIQVHPSSSPSPYPPPPGGRGEETPMQGGRP